MAGLLRGFFSWNHREVLAKREMDIGQQRYVKALEAEDELGAVVTALGHLADHIHLRKRVFVAQENRTREIDVIAVTGVLYVVEVKNWAGKIWRNGERWFQLPPRAGARALEFNDVLAECEYKAKALVRFLHRNGVDVPPGSVRAIVVFASNNAKLDPATLGKDPSVFTREQFRTLIEQRSAWHDTLTSWAPMLFARANEVTPPLRARINRLLAATKTWDTIIRHNGERTQGDVRWIRLPEYDEWRHPSDRDQFLNVMRKDIDDARVVWTSSTWYGAIASIWQGSAGVLQLRVKPYLKLAPTKARLKRLGVPTHGHTERGDYRKKLQQSGAQEPAPATLTVHLTARSAKRSVTEVNHVVIHPAGSEGPIQVPLSEIATLELSAHSDDLK